MGIVKVACYIPNGVSIARYAAGHDDGTGKRPPRRVGEPIALKGPDATLAGAGNTEAKQAEPGITEIDAEWFDGWLKENENSPMVTSGFVKIVERVDDEPQDPTPQE